MSVAGYRYLANGSHIVQVYATKTVGDCYELWRMRGL